MNPGNRHLVLIPGDQLDPTGPALDDFRADADAVLIAEVAEEASSVRQHKQRLVLFLAAMRHMRDALRSEGRTVHYTSLDDPENAGSIAGELERRARALEPEKIIVAEPGDHRVLEAIRASARSLGLPLEVREDHHFLCSHAEFRAHATGRRQLLMENFYRGMRRRHGILVRDNKPVGGRWNYDAENRGTFGVDGPRAVPPPIGFAPDETTLEVMALVGKRFDRNPGHVDGFDYPVTKAQARAALDDFIEHRLPWFGQYQDAMATGEPYLYHSRLSSALNLHLLSPRDTIRAALAAGEAGHAPLNAVEGFVRQVLGWREFVRGIYWWRMPDYAGLNALDAELPMPAFMWTAETEMVCIRESVGQLVEHAYAHHIQRLMVLGLFALLLGVRPDAVNRWHLSMYIDAIDWVSTPNVVGMSQFADGGIVGTKPYCASGNYINRMSDYCSSCRFNPKKSQGDDACPFTTLYWDFLNRNREKLEGNHRMGFQLRNLARKTAGEISSISRRADAIKTDLTGVA